MKTGPIITTVVAITALTAVVTAFMSNASPYVTIAQAKTSSDKHLHLSGDIVKESVRMNLVGHYLTFQLKDSDGAIVTVEHRKEPPANIQEATKVVAIGGMEGDRFVSEKLLVKCPSKYEAEKNKPEGGR